MSDVTIIGTGNEPIYSFRPDGEAHVHIYLSASENKISLPLRGAEGIDVSRNQLKFDWAKAKADGCQFAWIRATMGAPSNEYPGVDDRWRYNRVKCRAQGIADGIYHYMIHSIPAAAQFDNIQTQIGGDFGSLPLVVDVERRRFSGVAEAVNPPVFTSNLLDLLRQLEAYYHHKPLIYTSKIEWEAMTTTPTWERDYQFIVAQYAPTLTAIRPAWSVAAWQYSTAGNTLDRDRWLGQAAPQPSARHNFAPRTNQQVINLFYAAAGKANYIEWITRAGLSDTLTPNTRKAVYAGPDVEALPLTADERAALIAQLTAK